MLEQLAKERFRSLGSSALASECKEIKPCYALADGELCCHFSEELATLPSLARWTLSKVEVQARARAWLLGVQDIFWQDVDIDGLRISEGLLSVASVATVFGTKAVKGLGQEDVAVVDALASLQAAAARRSLSKDRRRLSEKIFSRLLTSLAAAIDGSRDKPIWTDVRVESLDQLRTCVLKYYSTKLPKPSTIIIPNRSNKSEKLVCKNITIS